MSPITLLLILTAVLSVYPLALALVVTSDFLVGSGAFANEVMYGSSKRLLDQVVNDWARSSGLWLPLSLIVVAIVRSRWGRGLFYLSIVLGLSALASFAFVSLSPPMIAGVVGTALIIPAFTRFL